MMEKKDRGRKGLWAEAGRDQEQRGWTKAFGVDENGVGLRQEIELYRE